MPRNRIFSAAQALYVGPTPATGSHYSSGNSGINQVVQLNRIQSFNFNSQIPRTDVNQLGQVNSIDRPFLRTPNVPFTFTYYVANLWNEAQLGFNIGQGVSALSGFFSKASDDKNYFLQVAPEGQDANGRVDAPGQVAAVNGNVIGIGNAYITSYSVSASVGGLPVCSVGGEGLNWVFDVGVSGNNIPAVHPVSGYEIYSWNYEIPTANQNIGTGDLALSVLRPGDILLAFKLAGTDNNYGQGGISIDDAKLQNFSLSVGMSRTPIEQLGSKYAVSREINTPAQVKLTCNAIAGDLTTGSLNDVLSQDSAYDVTVSLCKTTNSGHGTCIVQHQIKNTKLDSISWNGAVGGNADVAFDFVGQIGGTSTSTTAGYFQSGIYR